MYMIQDVTFIIQSRYRDFALLQSMNIMRHTPYCFECVLHTFIQMETLHVIFEGQTFSYHITFHTLCHLRFCMSDLTKNIKKQTLYILLCKPTNLLIWTVLHSSLKASGSLFWEMLWRRWDGGKLDKLNLLCLLAWKIFTYRSAQLSISYSKESVFVYNKCKSFPNSGFILL